MKFSQASLSCGLHSLMKVSLQSLHVSKLGKLLTEDHGGVLFKNKDEMAEVEYHFQDLI